MGFELSVAQGIMGYEAAQGEKAQYQFNAKSDKIAADQDSAARLNDLISTNSSINAIRASNGLSLTSPTGLAITQATTQRAQTGIDTSRFNYMAKQQNDLFGASQAQAKSYASLLGGFLQGTEMLAGAAKAGAGGG